MTAPRPGLNWRDSQHWGGGRLLPCVHCGTGALCRDQTGRPCHKTCAEAALLARLTADRPTSEGTAA